MDFFPEEGYDPDSGEYQSNFDFEPVYTSRIELAPGVFATIEITNPDFTPTAQSMSDVLQNLVNYGYFDAEGNRNPRDYPLLQSGQFDTQSKTARGPFIDTAQVQKFLDESGLEGQVDVWYDDIEDLYWIDADTGSAD